MSGFSVFAPASDEFFFAARGQGAARNFDPVHATSGTELNFSRIAGPKPLVENAAPLLAAVFVPASDEFFFAARGQGAARNGVPVSASPGAALDFSRIAGPKPLVERLNRSSGELTLYPRIGSLALRLCRVAEGTLDAAFAGGQSRDWDLAAADLIVQEANGNMTALSGDSILYNLREVTHGVLVAAGRERHASIVEHFRRRPLP